MTRRRTPSQHIPAMIAAHQLRTLTGRSHAILTGRAAAAIQTALEIWDVRDSAVIIPANTCYIVLWAVINAGGVPFLADCDPVSGNVTAESLDTAATFARAAGYDAAAAIPCHMYGIPAPMRSISEWAARENIRLIEDSALGIGIDVDGKPAGSWGDLAVFSFGQGKVIDTDVGAAALTGDPVLANAITARLAALPVFTPSLAKRCYQWEQLYWALHQFETENPALNALYPQLFALYRDITAHRLSASSWRALPHALDMLHDDLTRRRALVDAYDAALGLDRVGKGVGYPLWKYPVLVEADQRDDVLRALWTNGLTDAGRWYPSLQAMRSALCGDLPATATPHADALAARVITLGLDIRITHATIERITAIMLQYRA